MKSEQKKRSSPISYRPPRGLEDEFVLRVERSGLSTNAYISSLWCSAELPRKVRSAPIEKAILARILGKLAIIADELRCARRFAETDENIRQIVSECRESLVEVRALVFRTMGRRG